MSEEEKTTLVQRVAFGYIVNPDGVFALYKDGAELEARVIKNKVELLQLRARVSAFVRRNK